jgi:hypothetical protein
LQRNLLSYFFPLKIFVLQLEIISSSSANSRKKEEGKLHENDMISDGYKRNKQLQIPEKNQKIITQTFTEKKVSCTALCAFRTLALTCCKASCLSPTPLLPTPFFNLNSHLLQS